MPERDHLPIDECQYWHYNGRVIEIYTAEGNTMTTNRTNTTTDARRILRNAALHCYHSGNLLYEGYQLTDEQRGYEDAFCLLTDLWQYGCVLPSLARAGTMMGA